MLRAERILSALALLNLAVLAADIAFNVLTALVSLTR
jgi:hypothetical protein